jgi:hypothetical protein
MDAMKDPAESTAGTPRIPLPRPELDPTVLEDEQLLEDVRAGRRGPEDPDPLVRLLAVWRAARRRPRRRAKTGFLNCRKVV